MKKLFYLIGIVSIFFIGCSKNTDLQLEKEQVVVLPEVNLTDIVKSFDSENATFSNQNEYAAFIMKFSKLSRQEKQNLISLVKYKTIDEILDEAYEGMNNLQTREEFVEYLKQYNDYLELMELPNGEEEVQEKEITGHTIYSFLNKDKIIKIGNTYYKYFSEICVQSKNKEELLKLNTTEEAINSDLKYYTAYTNDYSKFNSDEIELRWGEVNYFRKWEEQNDKFWCKNKRKVTFTIGIGREIHVFNDPFVGILHQRIYYEEAKVVARRKGIACIWYKYKTTITWNDYHSEYDLIVNGVISHVVRTAPNVTKSNVKSIKRGGVIWVDYKERGDLLDCQWTIIKSNITTRGIWDKWLKVNWHN